MIGQRGRCRDGFGLVWLNIVFRGLQTHSMDQFTLKYAPDGAGGYAFVIEDFGRNFCNHFNFLIGRGEFFLQRGLGRLPFSYGDHIARAVYLAP